jgi:hypothetical protein
VRGGLLLGDGSAAVLTLGGRQHHRLAVPARVLGRAHVDALAPGVEDAQCAEGRLDRLVEAEHDPLGRALDAATALGDRSRHDGVGAGGGR